MRKFVLIRNERKRRPARSDGKPTDTHDSIQTFARASRGSDLRRPAFRLLVSGMTNTDRDWVDWVTKRVVGSRDTSVAAPALASRHSGQSVPSRGMAVARWVLPTLSLSPPSSSVFFVSVIVVVPLTLEIRNGPDHVLALRDERWTNRRRPSTLVGRSPLDMYTCRSFEDKIRTDAPGRTRSIDRSIDPVTGSEPSNVPARATNKGKLSGSRLVRRDPQPGVVREQYPRTAMCVRSVDVHVSCSSQFDAQLAAFFIDPRAK